MEENTVQCSDVRLGWGGGGGRGGSGVKECGPGCCVVSLNGRDRPDGLTCYIIGQSGRRVQKLGLARQSERGCNNALGQAAKANARVLLGLTPAGRIGSGGHHSRGLTGVGGSVAGAVSAKGVSVALLGVDIGTGCPRTSL